MNVNDILLFDIQILFIVLSIVAIIDYVPHRTPQRRDFALLASALGFPLGITFLRRFFPLQSFVLDFAGAFALFSQPYFLFRLLQHFRPNRPRVTILILVGFVACCLLLISGVGLNRALTVTLIFSYCTVAEAYSTWGFAQGMQSTTGTLRRRLRIITISSLVFTIAFLINAIKATFPALVLGITPYAQAAAAISAILFYVSFIPPRWLRRAWQMEELSDYLSQTRIASASDRFVIESLQQLSQRAKQATNATVGGVLTRDESSHGRQILAATNHDLFERLVQNGALLIKRAWEQRYAIFCLVPDIPDVDERRQLQALGAQTWLLVPVQSKEHLWGVLIVALQNRSLFIDDDLHMLELLAQECALVLDNHRLIDELQNYSGELERKVEERTAALQRSNEELRNYAYIASHDLQEPLRMVTSYLELIEMRFPEKLGDDGREFIAFAVDGAKRMKNLINDLLVYSRIDTRSHNYRLLDVQDVVDKAERSLRAAIAEADARITHDTLPQIIADDELMFQIFQNLIGNAIKYRGARKPEIHISALCQDQDWIFSVRDNGIGIEQRFLERIFVIFQRLHTREKYPGTGIGLAVCKKAVELHDGRIWAESEVDQGSTFHFTIPVHNKSADVPLSNAS